MARIVLAVLAMMAGVTAVLTQGESVRVADRAVVDAYECMLGRWLVLRQEALDLKDGLNWSEVTRRIRRRW
jgi:hypothetical protein